MSDTQEKSTPGLLHLENGIVICEAGGCSVGEMSAGYPQCSRSEMEANAQLVVASWNAAVTVNEHNPLAAARALPDAVEALEGLLAALAMGPLDIAAKYGPDAHPDEPVIDAARKGQTALSAVHSGKEG